MRRMLARLTAATRTFLRAMRMRSIQTMRSGIGVSDDVTPCDVAKIESSS